MKKHPKPGYLGPAFHRYLEYLETVEHAVVTGKQPKKFRNTTITVNNRLWDCGDEEQFGEMIKDAFPVDAVLAGVVRSSVKYKLTVDTFVQLGDTYGHELLNISRTTPVHLPHEWCTIIVEGFGNDDIILVAQRQTADNHKSYPELELEPDEPFICLNIGAYRSRGVELEDGTTSQNNKLSYFPVEIHMREGVVEKGNKVLYAMAGKAEPTKQGQKIMDLLYRTFLIWHHQFHLQSLLRSKSIPGAKASPGRMFRRTQLRKRIDHPQFEHTIIQVEMDSPEPSQTGRSMFQPHKRLHQVRGFWRHYKKTGRKVWVKPHWRGDEKLGVVKRDFEMIMHDH